MRRAGALYAAGLVLLVGAAFPLFWMLSTALKPSGEIFATPRFVPLHPTLENFQRLFADTSFLVFFRNSVAVAGATVLLTLAVSSLGAYSLTRYRFRGRDAVAGLILLTYMFAPIMIIIPFYILVKQLGIVNTHLALVLSYTTFCLPFCLWVLRAFFQSIPLELEEAALVDGAGRGRTVWHVVLPLALPGPDRGRDLHVHPGLERLPVRPGPHHLRGAEDPAGGRQRPVQRHHRGLGHDHGRGGDDHGAHRLLLRGGAALPRAGMGVGRGEGLRERSESDLAAAALPDLAQDGGHPALIPPRARHASSGARAWPGSSRGGRPGSTRRAPPRSPSAGARSACRSGRRSSWWVASVRQEPGHRGMIGKSKPCREHRLEPIRRDSLTEAGNFPGWLPTVPAELHLGRSTHEGARP